MMVEGETGENGEEHGLLTCTNSHGIYKLGAGSENIQVRCEWEY